MQGNEMAARPRSSVSRARACAFVGLSIALIAISAWITIPIGPIPVTMQMFSIAFMICVLPTPWATAAIFAYVALGAIGVPVFSGFRGGIGVLLGPTGGFLLGYLIAVPIASLFINAVYRRTSSKGATFACQIAAGAIFTLIAYVPGTLQYAALTGISIWQAAMVASVPFIGPDLIKVTLAALAAEPIRKILR